MASQRALRNAAHEAAKRVHAVSTETSRSDAVVSSTASASAAWVRRQPSRRAARHRLKRRHLHHVIRTAAGENPAALSAQLPQQRVDRVAYVHQSGCHHARQRSIAGVAHPDRRAARKTVGKGDEGAGRAQGRAV
ncbi:hypothetical protein RGR602_CH00949 [Rhizobium gallicum bv. gallicum R602sp]|uniref:Uncharacterized protein n=1 Tax=Rhizobium gallicum bv. gallicum R602sp TaxID=1041138 RepID=A0A0B4X0L1_9HYPH|nr:hypothetical protein RGR602_CH00949 [Rhizobium gallicum bv. gallicum R602sp]